MRRALIGTTALGLAVSSLVLCRSAAGDVVQTMDGKWHGLPKDVVVGPNEVPSDDVLRQTAEAKVEATYETVKLRSFTSSAGLVKSILSSDRVLVEAFKEGLTLAEGNLFGDALDSFKAAAEEAAGFGKQEALYWRMVAASEVGPEELQTAIDELLTAFPNSYYFADAHILRAKLLGGDPDKAIKELEKIKAAKGMNLRDQYRAEYMRIYLFVERARKYDEARKAYEALVAQIEKGDAVQGATTRQLALVGIGNCMLRMSPPDPEGAKKVFAKAAGESRDPDVLAGAFLGLGNVAFGTAKRLQDEKNLPAAKDALTESTLHYLRVTVLYREGVSEIAPVLDAYENQAKAFAALFRQSDGKDCTSADRAYKAYYELASLLPGGAEKKRINREGYEFNQERKAKGCK